ncbi:MAG: hypothetical protein IJQ90_03565 [Alphaproteobacteria bacterium]|nr:hypothetical protein [Alphaproteobacteria bacterium]
MRRFFISIIGALAVFSAGAAGETVPTTKSYVDSALTQKQDTIERTTGASQVLTNTGTEGEVGTKEIYDSAGAYVEQSNALIDAQTMNTGVQNAIDSEFQCISWVDDDPTKDCLLMELMSQRPKNILNKSNIHQGTIRGVDGKVETAGNRCYFDYIHVKSGDIINITSKSGTPPVHSASFLYSAPTENAFVKRQTGTQITVGDHVGYQFRIGTDGYVRGLWAQTARFSPNDIVEPMVEISATPHEYVPYKIYLPAGN